MRIKATCIVRGDRSNKHLGDRQRMRLYRNFVCMCLRKHLLMKVNQKLTKSMPRSEDIHYGTFTREKCKKLRVKQGEGICLKGVYFRELCVP